MKINKGKIAIVALLFSAFSSICFFSNNTIAVGVISANDVGNNPWNRLLRATQIELATEAFYGCMHSTAKVWGQDSYSDGVFRNAQDDIWLNITKINYGGAWLEKNIAGSVNDGEFYCDEKTDGSESHGAAASEQGLQLLMTQLYGYGNDTSKLACGANGDNGMLSGVSVDCNKAYKSSWELYKVKINSNWNANLKALYNSVKNADNRTYEDVIANVSTTDNVYGISANNFSARKKYATAYLEADAAGCLGRLQSEKSDKYNKSVRIVSFDGKYFTFTKKWYYDGKGFDAGDYNWRESPLEKTYFNYTCVDAFEQMESNASSDWLNELNDALYESLQEDKNSKLSDAFFEAMGKTSEAAAYCSDDTGKTESRLFISWDLELEKPTSGTKTQSVFAQDITKTSLPMDNDQKLAEQLRTAAHNGCTSANPGLMCTVNDPPTFYNCCQKSDQSGSTLEDLKNANQCISVKGKEVTNPTSSVSNTSNSSTLEEDACYDGAGTFGWLLCPAIQATSGLASDIYGMIERDYLKIDTSSLFDLNGANGGVAYNAWDIVRNIANIVFAIFILVIIFSQLTGVGIDNYGIKRVLPRIIIAAILVNASWFICRIAIDLSNVVGLSLGDIINPGVIEIDASVADMAADKLSVYSSYVVTFGGASAIGLIALFINPGLILSVLLALLVVVFAVIFFWLILVAREVVVVLLIILAPLAFVCFLFPNTEKLFKRWLKIAEAAIILYPLCTLVVSGGRLVGAIMAEQANAYTASIISTFGFLEKGKGMRLAAMLVQVIPYFFIPMLLKNSMAGLGNLGAKISGLGSRLGRGLSGSIRKSDGFQNAQERSLERKNRIRAGLDKDGNIATGKRARFAQIAAGGISKRTVARSRNAYLKTQDEKYKYGLLGDQDHLDAARISQEKAAQKAAMADQMVLVNDATRNGEVEEGDNGLFAMYDEAMNSGNTTRARAIAEIAGRRKDTAARFLEHHDKFVASDKFTGDKGITADVMKQIATGDGAKNFRAADGVRFEYASKYNQNPSMTASFEEWRQNGSNVSTAIEHNITNGADLYGQKNGSLYSKDKETGRETGLVVDVQSGRVAEEQLRQLQRAIQNTQTEQFRSSSAYDATKDANINKLNEAVREQLAKIDAERARQNEAAARSTEEYWKD